MKSKCCNVETIFTPKGNHIGIYCSKCHKWQKWANKNDLTIHVNEKENATNVSLETENDALYTRTEFLELFNKCDGYYIMDAIDDFGQLFETDSYIIYHCEEVSIIVKSSLDSNPKVINWYKYTHIGRCLNITNMDKYDVENMLTELVQEIIELRKRREHINEM